MLPTLTELAVARVDLDARIEALNEQRAEVNEQIRSHPDAANYGKHAAGNLNVTRQANHRFDQTLAQQVIPTELLPLVTVTTETTSIDKKRVEVLAPTYLDACTKGFPDKVVVS